MLKDPYFRMLFGILIVIAILHLLGVQLYLYWQISYYDMILHFLGGFWVGGMCLWGLTKLIAKDFLTKNLVFVLSATGAFLIGILWEYFELFIDAVFVTEEEYVLDTILDLILDMLGAIAAIWLYYFLYAKQR